MRDTPNAKLDASELRIGIVVSRYHREVTDALLAGAKKTFTRAKGKARNLLVVEAPGAWELTALCSMIAYRQDAGGLPMFHGIVALGCILTGETTHDQYIAQSVTQGLTTVTLETGVPVAFGVLTCQSMEQAMARRKKGEEAMAAAIATAHAMSAIRDLDGEAL